MDKNDIIVRVNYSCISQGTELNSTRPKSKDDYDLIRRGLNAFKTNGILKTVHNVIQKPVRSPQAIKLGYSLSGIVEDVGENIDDIQIGDHVACAGAGFANHAEFVQIPRNLIVKMPEKLAFKEASTVTIGGIAMQGVRRGNFSLGEFVVVYGLGLVGQITAQLLMINGCRVIGIDILDERCKMAKKAGAEKVFNGTNLESLVGEIIKYSDGYGVDGVIFAADTDDPEVISSAFKMTRKKGKVVIVGVAGNEIKRKDLYQKEIDYLISTSYGPGRYDEKYEQKGLDYPYAYVRWTENRNMKEYLRLLSEKMIILDIYSSATFSPENADESYLKLQNKELSPLIAYFEYRETATKDPLRTVVNKKFKNQNDVYNIAIIGAGHFAKAMHLPNLAKLKDKFNIYAICTKDPLNANETAEKFTANYATTDYKEVLKDENVDAVLICTRHDKHAEQAKKALLNGKAVFLEKPMALNRSELDELFEVVTNCNLPFMIGFNRSYSPAARMIKEKITERSGPLIMTYRMNAGYLSQTHWVHTEEGGGRIIGEACHIIDLFNDLINAEIKAINVDRITPANDYYSPEDNAVITLNYSDGSLASLVFTSMGNREYPKESCELFFDGNVIEMEDFAILHSYGNYNLKLDAAEQDKGHVQELHFFYDLLKGLKSVNVENYYQTTLATILLK